MSRGGKGENLFLCLSLTLGARDFSSAVSGFCQVFIVKSDPREKFPKIPASREKNLWYSGYLSLWAGSTFGGVARSHAIATRERRRECEWWIPPPLSASRLASLATRNVELARWLPLSLHMIPPTSFDCLGESIFARLFLLLVLFWREISD